MSFDYEMPIPEKPQSTADKFGIKNFPLHASKFFPATSIARNSLYTMLSHHNKNAGFTIRAVTENGVVGYRAWRIK